MPSKASRFSFQAPEAVPLSPFQIVALLLHAHGSALWIFLRECAFAGDTPFPAFQPLRRNLQVRQAQLQSCLDIGAYPALMHHTYDSAGEEGQADSQHVQPPRRHNPCLPASHANRVQRPRLRSKAHQDVHRPFRTVRPAMRLAPERAHRPSAYPLRKNRHLYRHSAMHRIHQTPP